MDCTRLSSGLSGLSYISSVIFRFSSFPDLNRVLLSILLTLVTGANDCEEDRNDSDNNDVRKRPGESILVVVELDLDL